MEVRQQLSGTRHNLKVIDNGGRLSMAVIFKHRMTEDEWQVREQAVREKFSGSNNAGQIAVISAPDMEIKEMGQSNKDMDFTALDTKSREAVFMRYGVPLPLVSSTRQTFNNFDRAIEDFYDRAVLPNLNILFSGLTRALKSRYNDSFEAITYNPDSITALKRRLMEELKARRDANIETVNELREILPNREPLEGGDIFYQPATLIPAGEDIFTEEVVDVDDAIRD